MKTLLRKNLYNTLVVLAAISCVSCGPKERKVTGTSGKVVSIIDGNTLELQNGLTVELLGIKPSHLGEEYMETHVKGKTVKLIADKKDPRQTYRYASAKVRAYVRVGDERGSLNGKLLQLKRANGIELNHLNDSAEVYSTYWNGKEKHVLMSAPELLSVIRPATFLIVTDAGFGTGFFINENGLALTNNHVLNEKTQEAVIYFFNENGGIDRANYLTINIKKGILATYTDNERIDYTIFRPELYGGEKVPYLSIAQKRAIAGEAIAKLGCPSGNLCNFQTGNLSNYEEDSYTFIHSIGTNHGDSGGPIVNFYGEVLGINQSIDFNTTLTEMSGSLQKTENVAHAVDIMLIKNILEENGIEYGR